MQLAAGDCPCSMSLTTIELAQDGEAHGLVQEGNPAATLEALQPAAQASTAQDLQPAAQASVAQDLEPVAEGLKAAASAQSPLPASSLYRYLLCPLLGTTSLQSPSLQSQSLSAGMS